ncbi:MAG: DUF438 domain-containing protein [Lentisphaerae bacterium]|nr:DUF438 domain-containing protein [Lentisphaerota bacterium]
MSTLLSEHDCKKALVKDIIRKLHQGLSVEQAKARLEAEVGSISSSEIAEIEQALITEGMAPDEIKKFCNVHALLYYFFNYRGRFLHIRYFAVRDGYRQYLGTLEVTQDLTAIRQLTGEKRLPDEKN